MRSVILLVVLFSGCVQVGGPKPADVTGAGEVPFTLAGAGGAAVVVPVKINGTGPYQFVLDTGATLTCVDQALAARLELPKPVGVIGYGAGVGTSGAVSLHRIDTLQVGDTSASGVTACALDLKHVNQTGLAAEGLLGLNFLKSFKVTLDFERRVMSLAPVP